MALTKVTYTDDVTVIEAQNMNDIQDAIIAMETVPLVAVNSDLNNIGTPGVYRVWGTYTNAPKTASIYGFLTVSGVSGALIQMYQSATATDSYFRSYTNSQWYPWKQFILDTGGTFSGTVYINRADGTASTTGASALWVGNNIPTGTDGNSKGQVVIYGNGANYVNIQATNATGNRTVELPDANGTIMLSDTKTLDSNHDLNNFRSGGFYGITMGVANAPANYCNLLVMSGTQGCSQIVFDKNAIYTRMYKGNPLTWSSWYKYTGTVVS